MSSIHINFCYSPSIGYVAHPVGKIPNLKKAVGYVGHCKTGSGSYVTELSDRDRTREVYACVYVYHDVVAIIPKSIHELAGQSHC